MSFSKYRYPECMLPDGGPACSQYRAAFARIEQLEDELADRDGDLESLKNFCLSEIKKMPPEYVKGKRNE